MLNALTVPKQVQIFSLSTQQAHHERRMLHFVYCLPSPDPLSVSGLTHILRDFD